MYTSQSQLGYHCYVYRNVVTGGGFWRRDRNAFEQCAGAYSSGNCFGTVWRQQHDFHRNNRYVLHRSNRGCECHVEWRVPDRVLNLSVCTIDLELGILCAAQS